MKHKILKIKQLNEISDTLLKGRITELKCELWLLEHGIVVSTPNIPYQYDFLIDVSGKVLKIQVKTSHEDNDAIAFSLCSLTHNASGYTKRVYNENAVDYFMTEFNGQYYLVPFNECGTREKKLRLKPTKNNQTKGVSFAKDYLAEKVLGLEEVVE